jgi:hypothetical protein
MLTRGLLFAAIVCFALLAQPFSYPFQHQNQDKEERLTAKIGRESNPGKKARLQIRLARVKLTEAVEAYDADNFDQGWDLLKEYRQQVNLSWLTLQGSGREVRKHAEAYKQLEINLREDARLIDDLRKRLPYPENEKLEAIAEDSGRVHNQVLEVLFPKRMPPKKSKKPGQRGALLEAASAIEA